MHLRFSEFKDNTQTLIFIYLFVLACAGLCCGVAFS